MVKLGIFKKIFYNWATCSPYGKSSFFQELFGASFNFLLIDALIATKVQNYKRKKTKSLTIFGWIGIAKRFENIPSKVLMPPPIAIQLMKSSKQRVLISSSIIKYTPSKHIENQPIKSKNKKKKLCFILFFNSNFLKKSLFYPWSSDKINKFTKFWQIKVFCSFNNHLALWILLKSFQIQILKENKKFQTRSVATILA